MRKTLDPRNLSERPLARALAALSLSASLAAFGCSTNHMPGNGQPAGLEPTVGTTAPGVSGTSSGTTTPPPMVSSSTYDASMLNAATVNTVNSGASATGIHRRTADEAAAIMAGVAPLRGRVLGPVSPATNRPAQSAPAIVTGQFINPALRTNPEVTVNSSISSPATPAITSGAGDGLDADAVFAEAVLAGASTTAAATVGTTTGTTAGTAATNTAAATIVPTTTATGGNIAASGLGGLLTSNAAAVRSGIGAGVPTGALVTSNAARVTGDVGPGIATSAMTGTTGLTLGDVATATTIGTTTTPATTTTTGTTTAADTASTTGTTVTATTGSASGNTAARSTRALARATSRGTSASTTSSATTSTSRRATTTGRGATTTSASPVRVTRSVNGTVTVTNVGSSGSSQR